MVTVDVCVCVFFQGPDNGKSEGYGLRLVRPDLLGQEIEGKCDCWSEWIHGEHVDANNVLK